MMISGQRRPCRASTVVVLSVSGAILAACASSETTAIKHPKEYFSEAAYGVKASPRVTNKRSRLPRGGGRDQLGAPYMVAGKWYYPKEDRHYKKIGAASWYGDAFHGRLTANGEIYDMTNLTAAHPTMPLPSYARVTNTVTGSSVIVRVNDRGPYEQGRIIDLSRRAAELLDYMNGGTAKVKVEYIGRAPLEGSDDQYLLASYRPGNRAPDPSVGLPAGVMVAMNGATPSIPVRRPPVPFPGTASGGVPVPVPVAVEAAPGEFQLPAFGPIAPERPLETVANPGTRLAVASLSYADERVSNAARAFAAFDAHNMTPADVVASWKRENPSGTQDGTAGDYVAAGSFASEQQAKALARVLSASGRTVLEESDASGKTWYTVNVYPDGREGLDSLLQTAWANGAPDAMTVRD